MSPVHVEAAKNIRNVAVVKEPFVVPGFQVNAVECGMKYRGRLDLGLIVSDDEGSPCAAVFTKNVFTAAPVEVSKKHLARSGNVVKAVLVNSGIANACTGYLGVEKAERSCEVIAKVLGIPNEKVIVASTGVIGSHIDVQKIQEQTSTLIKGLKEDKWDIFAKAIMTTDTVPKFAYGEIETDTGKICMGGVAKGSGMIAPNMATMLSFICTNACVELPNLQYLLQTAVEKTFNCITVDGDTSTNDMVVLLARNRGSRGSIALKGKDDLTAFKTLLHSICEDLAKQIVEDGEGATKFVEICVDGASSYDDAKRIAKTIAESPLVKTAFFGADANWGRIIAAAGRSGVAFDPHRVSLFFNDLCVFENGVPILNDDVEREAARIFQKNSFIVTFKLHEGEHKARVWTCDLSHGYVDINANYRT